MSVCMCVFMYVMCTYVCVIYMHIFVLCMRISMSPQFIDLLALGKFTFPELNDVRVCPCLQST